MKLKKVVLLALVSALLSMAVVVRFARPVKADWTWTETIYIRADGSVHPPTAPISSADNITYTLTDNIVGDVPEYSSVIVVERDNIVVDGAGYTLQGKGAWESKGIDLTGRNNVTITNVEVKAFREGIYLWNSSNNNLSMNIITNGYFGILLGGSSNNTISGNNLRLSTQPTPDDAGTGVAILYSSNYNNISGNTIENTFEGIQLQSSSNNNSVSGNNVKNNYYGIDVSVSSDYNNVSGNTVTSGRNGIHLERCSNNIVSGNNVTENYGFSGITVYPQALNNILYKNHVVNNYRGITLWEASYNSIYSNSFINNTQQVYIITSGYNNLWDDGYPSGGNYWSDYGGTDFYSGPYQNISGSDGIGDNPYLIGSNNQDNYPLMNPLVSPNEMRAIYSELQNKYNDLNATYYELLADYGNLKIELNNIRNLMYIFIIITIIFIATTVYFATRKPKTMPTAISEA